MPNCNSGDPLINRSSESGTSTFDAIGRRLDSMRDRTTPSGEAFASLLDTRIVPLQQTDFARLRGRARFARLLSLGGPVADPTLPAKQRARVLTRAIEEPSAIGPENGGAGPRAPAPAAACSFSPSRTRSRSRSDRRSAPGPRRLPGPI